MIEIGNNNKFINSQICGDGILIVNGEEIPQPPVPMTNITTINGNIFVDGYEYKDGE